jgi:hypothetical protein
MALCPNTMRFLVETMLLPLRLQGVSNALLESDKIEAEL